MKAIVRQTSGGETRLAASAVDLVGMLLLPTILAFSVSSTSLGISTTSRSILTHNSRHHQKTTTAPASSCLFISKENEIVPETVSGSSKQPASFRGAVVLDFVLSPHRPLGCTVEESLANEVVLPSSSKEDQQHHVFVSKVVPGGFAEQAGIQVGDVIVGVSGLFGRVQSVRNWPIDKVKGLVTARPDTEPLAVQVARGTTVLADHERALVELCSDPSLDGAETEQCLLDYLQGGYDYSTTMDNDDEQVKEATNGSSSSRVDGAAEPVDTGMDNEEDLVNNIYSMWAEDNVHFSSAPAKPLNGETGNPAEGKQPKPWSSRSSPSGTFVRDPRTGKMRNIDK